MNNLEKTNGKPDCNHDSPANELTNSHYTSSLEAVARQQIIEYNDKRANYLAWDLGALKHNLSTLDPVLSLLCFDLKKLDKEQLKSLIHCSRDTLEKAIFDLTVDCQSVIQRFNSLFPEMGIKKDDKNE